MYQTKVRDGQGCAITRPRTVRDVSHLGQGEPGMYQSKVWNGQGCIRLRSGNIQDVSD